MDDLIVEIFALKSNSTDLYKLRNTASTNLTIGADKKHTTIMGKNKTTSHRNQKKETAYGKHKTISFFVKKVICRRGFIFSANRSKCIEVVPMEFNHMDIVKAVSIINSRTNIRCHYDNNKDEIRLYLKGIK